MSECLIPHDPAAAAIPIDFVAKSDLEATLAQLSPETNVWARAHGFEARISQVLTLPAPDGSIARVLFGVGDGASTTSTNEPLAAGRLATALPPALYAIGTGCAAPAQAALAFALGSYRYKRGTDAIPRLMVPAGIDADRLAAIVDGVTLTRDLINTPANRLSPRELAQAGEDVFRRVGGTSTVIEADALIERGFPLVSMVGQSSSRPPCLFEGRWGREGAPRVTLVGKGVVFDTGGLNVKPDAAMRLMKKDMGGAAHVLGLAHMIAQVGLDIHLRVIVPAVENAVSSTAFRPGDVVESRKGPTVEIGHTDAEGRLILADALAYADEEAPDLLFDFATLTGAARVAVGPDIAAVFSSADTFITDLCAHAAACEDPVWRLPLWAPYRRYLASPVADLNNVNTSGVGFAGATTAALFLARFVEKAKTWAHFDIYGWTPAERPGKPLGGEAQAIRAVFALLAAHYGTRAE